MQMTGGDIYEKDSPLLFVAKETKHEKYNRSEKGRARYARYRASTKGIINEHRVGTRKRIAKIIQLESELTCIKNQISKWRDCE